MKLQVLLYYIICYNKQAVHFVPGHHQFEHFGLEQQKVVSKLGNSLRLVFFCFCIQN